MGLNGKKIIVTGGARGIGAAVVHVYAKAGARVVALDVLDEQGKEVAKKASQHGKETVHYLHCDISNQIEVENAFEMAVEKLGGLDVLANVAGVLRLTPAEEISVEELDLVMKINFNGTVYTNQSAFKYLKENGGRIINFASIAGMNPYPQGASYSASKGAVTSWTRTVAHEWGKYNITVNALAPAIWTPMYDQRRSVLTEDELKAHDENYKKLIPIGGKLGDPERDLGPVMVFLASEDSRFITGQLIPVDGGMASTR